MASNKRSMGWEDVPDSINTKNFYDMYDAVTLEPNEWTQFRLVGDIVMLKIGWIPAKKKGGGLTAYPVVSLSNNEEDCPLVEAGIKQQDIFLTNVIVRELQENKPRKAGTVPDQEFRKVGDKWWSPIKVLKLPFGAVQKVKNLGQLNKVKSKTGEIKVMPLNHPKFGRDILVSYDPKGQGSGMYDIQKEDRSPLTEEESSYLLYNLELVFDCIQTYDDIVESIQKAYDEDLFDDDNCNMKALRRLVEESDDDDDDDNDDDDMDLDEDDEDEPPKKKSKKKVVEDEDDDLDLDDDDDEDEPPKKKSKTTSKTKKKVVEDDDDDEDELDDDDLDLDDDEEDEPPKRSSKKKPPVKSKKKVVDDEDDLDLDDEDDLDLDADEEDEPPKRSKKSTSSKTQRRTKKSFDDEVPF